MPGSLILFLIGKSLIDLHSHILPGIDDGPRTIDESVMMGRVATEDGTRTIVATPHVDERFRPDASEITRLAGLLNIELSRARIRLAVIAGAEVAIGRLPDLSDDSLRGLALGTGPSLLVESPYDSAAPFLDEALFGLQVRGFRPVLAHPERCPAFQRDGDRLRALVARDVLCCVNAGSLAGQFGSTVRRFALRLLEEGLVHAVASDAHDAERRAPRMQSGFHRAETELVGIADQIGWFTATAPAAILRGESPSGRPPPPRRRSRGWRRLLGSR